MPASRLNRNGKRRRNKILLSLLLVLAGVLIVFFLGLYVFGSGYTSDDSKEKNDDEINQTQQPDASDDSIEKKADQKDEDSEEKSDKDDEDELDKEQLDTNKDNVRKAYTAEWQPVGTEQSGEHTINFDEGSQDREEMRTAVAAATGLDENAFIMWWIEGNGDQQVINTVSDPDETEIYRVYNQWVDGEGWKPTKVEELYKNDKK